MTALTKCRVCSPKIYYSRRNITSYLTSLWGGDSTNPFLDHWQGNSKDLVGIKPQHLKQANQQLQSEYHQKLSKIVRQLTAKDAASAVESDQAKSQLRHVLQQIDTTMAPLAAVERMALWLSLVDSSQSYDTTAAVTTIDWAPIIGLIHHLRQKCQNTDHTTLNAADFVLHQYMTETGSWLEQQERFQELYHALQSIQMTLNNAKNSEQLIAGMYNYIGVQTHIAQILGYESVVDQLFRNRTATLPAIEALHDAVRERIVPSLPQPSEFTALSELMSRGNSERMTPRQQQEANDGRAMVRLERHVTLDGAMAFLSRLLQDLLQVSLVHDAEFRGWNRTARLYHVMENDIQVGSFFLDPFDAKAIPRANVTVPIYCRSQFHSTPLLGVRLSADPPSWDTEPIRLTWTDTEALLHEVGHAVEYLLQSTKLPLGTVAGFETIPLDRTELLPKFLEHWLSEVSTIWALVQLSGISEGDCSEDSIAAAFRVRKRLKAQALSENAFFGSLELHLFSDFDLNGSESILALQARYAKTFIPHTRLHKTEISPLLEIFREQSTRPVGWYRYLWCDALSAQWFVDLKEQPQSAGQVSFSLRNAILEANTNSSVDPGPLFDLYGL